jgi:hypothetical protein
MEYENSILNKMKKYINVLVFLFISSMIYYISTEHYMIYIKFYFALFFTVSVSVFIYLSELGRNLKLWVRIIFSLVTVTLSILGGILPYMSLTHRSIYDAIDYASNPILIGGCVYYYFHFKTIAA